MVTGLNVTAKDTTAIHPHRMHPGLWGDRPYPQYLPWATESHLWSCSHLVWAARGVLATLVRRCRTPARWALSSPHRPAEHPQCQHTHTTVCHGHMAPPHRPPRRPRPCEAQLWWGPQPRAGHPAAAGVWGTPRRSRPPPGSNWVQQHMLQGCFNPAPGGCNPVQDLQCPDPELSRRNSQINGVGGFVQ